MQVHMLDRSETAATAWTTDRRYPHCKTVATSSSSSSAIPAGTKTRAEQDAEELRQGDDALPGTETNRNRDPDDHGDQVNIFIRYTVGEEADFERFMIGSRGS